MSQTNIMSTAMVAELLQSLGVELSIFVVTLAIAVAFRGTPFSRKACGSPKSSHPVHPKTKFAEHKKPSAGGRGASPGIKKPINHSATIVHTLVPTSGLAMKVDAIIELANRRQAADAIALYEEMKANGERVVVKDCGKHRAADVFGQLVQCAGRIGRPELVELLLDDMTHSGIDRSLVFYESTMKMLASKKCFKEAMSVCSRLEADGLEPSKVTLSCLINFAVETGEPDRAISFFNRLAATDMPSIRAYMTILRVYSRRQDWQQSLALIRDMLRRQAQIDSLVLNVVLATGVAANQLDATRVLLEEFSQIQIADVVSYNTVLKGFAQQKDVEGAVKLLDEMCQSDVQPNAITFNTAMDAAVRSSRIADAWHVLERMRDAGLAPDKFTCTTLMKGLQNGATSEQLVVILDLLRNMTSQCDATLCSSLFRTVIETAAQVNDPALTARAVAQMREQRVMLPAHEYQRLLQGLMRGTQPTHCRSAQQTRQVEAMRPIRAC